MRRAHAILLVLAIFFPLIAPLFAESAEARLPACCRRDGKHRCSMGMQGSDGPDQEARMRGSASPCPMFPSGKSAVPAGTGGIVPPAACIQTPLMMLSPVAEQARALFRISFARSRQKRGPPVLS